MQTFKITHAQQRWGKPDDAPMVDYVAAKPDDGGVYFTGTPSSVYRWGCSRTYRDMTLDAALREFMRENGQTLIKAEAL